MKNDTWLTDEARDALDAWEKSHQTWWELEQADPKEVRADLEAHLWHNREGSEEPVTLTQVEKAVDEMSLPSMNEWDAPHLRLEETPARRGFLGWLKDTLTHPFFYGIWPLLVVLWEIATGTLASMFFDPFSRVPQVILIVSFSIIGLLSFFKIFEKSKPLWLTILRGAGAVVAGYWGLLLLPVLVIGTFMYGAGIIYSFGIALVALPLYLLCAMVAAAPLYLAYGFFKHRYPDSHRTPWLIGMLLGLGLLLIVEGPAYVTRYGVANNDPAVIRSFGSEDTLLTMCYEGGFGRKRFTDTSGFIPSLGKFNLFGRDSIEVDRQENHRELYYRVTGKPFNSERPPDSSLLGGGRGGGGVTFDENLGGDGVSARVADLDLATSRLDAHVDSASGLGYWEWTMEFDNSGFRNKEARMQLLLPNDGVVSRLTLWVNDEPQEAAFSSTAKVTKAYKSVAIAERRDPVLVRWVGSDRVLVQCFPVLPDEDMRIRIGITAPLDSDGRLFLPRIIEKNFGISEELETDIWVQGDMEMYIDGLSGKGKKDKWRETHGSLSARDLMARHTHVKCDLPEQPSTVWTDDQFSGKKLIRTRLPSSSQESKGTLVLVIDGSGYFGDWADDADEAIAALRAKGHEVEVILAANEEVHENVTRLGEFSFGGGQDCIPALEIGLRLASEKSARHLIWLHGSQPVQFTSEEGFLQLLERGFNQVEFSVVDLAGGPNRLLEKAAKRIGIAGSARPSSPEELSGELTKLIEPSAQTYAWKVQDEVPAEGKQVWDHLARFHTWQQVKKAAMGSTNHAELAKLAAKYQLVTPVSGAVVLETKQDYKRFGLEQADGSTTPSVPGIPEPSTALLALIASLMLCRRKRVG